MYKTQPHLRLNWRSAGGALAAPALPIVMEFLLVPARGRRLVSRRAVSPGVSPMLVDTVPVLGRDRLGDSVPRAALALAALNGAPLGEDLVRTVEIMLGAVALLDPVIIRLIGGVIVGPAGLGVSPEGPRPTAAAAGRRRRRRRHRARAAAN